MKISDAKAWRCKNGHVLGLVARNGSQVRQLLLYRLAVSDDAGLSLEEIDVIAVVEGYVADVRCSICGCPRTWVPGQESMRRLVESRTESVA